MEQITVESKNSSQIQNPVMKPMEAVSEAKVDSSKMKLVAYFLIIILGVASGFGVYAVKTSGTARIAGKDVEVVKTPTEEGIKDAATFKDTATGQLLANDGKITSEGTHILKRGDISQNVYLTSSVIDLSKYEGKQVQVWGSTYQSQKAGWLMDVGRIKLAQ